MSKTIASLNSLNRVERQEWIVNYLLEKGSVVVDELVEYLGVSRMTIHRDLDELEQHGVLRKVRNGATAQPSSLFESDLRYRLKHAIKEKEALARVALNYIEPGQAIMLDEATTLLPLVQLLPAVTPLTVISNFLSILKTLAESKGIRLIGLGGEYLPQFGSFTGLICQQTVASLRADVYLTSTTAVAKGVAFHPDQQVARIKQAMIKATTRRILLLDHTKLGRTALYEVVPLQQFDVIVVDSGVSPGQLKELREAGVPVEVASLSYEPEAETTQG